MLKIQTAVQILRILFRALLATGEVVQAAWGENRARIMGLQSKNLRFTPEIFDMPPLFLMIGVAAISRMLICGCVGSRPAQTLLGGLNCKQFFVEQLKAVKRGWLSFTHPVLPINTLMLT